MKNLNRLAIGLLSALLAGSAAADVTVNFRNNVLSSAAVKVVFGRNPYGFAEGSPVVNANGITFVAQLYHDVGGSLTPVGAPANFRAVPQNDALAGTWSGANRTIVGPPADATVNLVVRVWDASFGSYDAVIAAGGSAGSSASFSYRNALSSPPATTDTYMVNFTGFQMNRQIPEPSTVALALAGVVSLLFLRSRPAKQKPGGSPTGPVQN
jgi:hypothetical protein